MTTILALMCAFCGGVLITLFVIWILIIRAMMAPGSAWS